MTSKNVIRRAGIIGALALAGVLSVGTASMAAAQNNAGNPFDALWAAIGDLQGKVDAQQEQIDALQAQVDALG